MLSSCQTVEQGVCIAFDSEHGMMSGCQKSFVAHMGEELEQEIIETADVEQADWLEV